MSEAAAATTDFVCLSLEHLNAVSIGTGQGRRKEPPGLEKLQMFPLQAVLYGQ